MVDDFSSLVPLYTYFNLPELIRFDFNSDSNAYRIPISMAAVIMLIVDNVTSPYDGPHHVGWSGQTGRVRVVSSQNPDKPRILDGTIRRSTTDV